MIVESTKMPVPIQMIEAIAVSLDEENDELL
jgi:hypothetical protein